MLLENRAGILSRQFGSAVARLAGVRWRAHIDVQPTLAVEGDALVLVLPLFRETGDDGLHRSGGQQRAGRHLVSLHRDRGGYVEVAVAKPQTRAASLAERLLGLQAPVAVFIA